LDEVDDPSAARHPSFSAADHVAVMPPREARTVSAIAVMCGVSRDALYHVLWTGRASEDLCAVLTPLIRQYEGGKLRFRRSGPPSDIPNHWEVIDT
jgi:hypothetical protein